MTHRKLKQFTIAFIFFLICASFASLIYLLSYEPRPSCFDGIQNQGETGIDCGGPCKICPPPKEIKDLKILWTKAIPSGPISYDLISSIKNPNKDWGIGSLNYQFTLYDKEGRILGQREGSSYILPNQEKFIIETLIDTIITPDKVSLSFDYISWQKLQNFKGLKFPVKEKKYKSIADGSAVGEVSGIVVNDNLYDFDKININIVLYDAAGEPVGVSTTDMATMMAGEKRYFNAIWYYPFPEEVSNFTIEIDTNLFDPQNILKRYGEGEKFMKYE